MRATYTEPVEIVKTIGCKECQTIWVGGCPVCKSPSKRWRTKDGFKAVGTKKIPKEFREYLRDKTEAIIPVLWGPVRNCLPKIKNGYSERKKELLEKYPRRVAALIMRGHAEQCACCGAFEDLTFDHVIPLSKGGINGLGNGQILCVTCNLLKDDNIISISDLRKMICK